MMLGFLGKPLLLLVFDICILHVSNELMKDIYKVIKKNYQFEVVISRKINVSPTFRILIG